MRYSDIFCITACLLTFSGANNGLPDFMALLLVDGYVQLVITLGAHPSAPLVLYMNRGDPLNNREWHTVEVIRSLKVTSSNYSQREKK